jgi:DNA-binding NtrC family response regulator
VQLSADAAAPPDPWAAFDFSGSLQEVARRGAAEAERRKLQKVLAETDQDKSRAAEALGITYKSLVSKLKEHRLVD